MKEFDNYIKRGVVKKQSPDKHRAEYLIEESEKEYSFLKEMLGKIPLSDNNANNYVKTCYDILMELIRAKMLMDGFNASGKGAHEAEVAYLRLLDFNSTDISFIDRLRYFRNGMLYYGTTLDSDYAKKVIEFTKKNYIRLRKLV